jgi:hypothetical protein
MKCDWTQKVSLLIDGELPPPEASAVETHLNLCADCQSAREDFLLLRRQIAVYPLEQDAFARRRALKRILAASGSGTGLENATAAATARRSRKTVAGVFAMSQFSPAGSIALLLLIGVVVGIAFLSSSRRAPVEFVTHAPAANDDNNNSSIAASNAQTPAPDDLTASANKPDGVERIGGDYQKRAGAQASKDESSRAARGAGANAQRGASANVQRAESANAQGVENANVGRVESAGGRMPGSSTPANLARRQEVDVLVAEAAGNDAEAVNNDAADAGDNAPPRREAAEAKDAQQRAETAGESKTARHVEQAQLLLRSFRNARPADAGRRASSDIAYEKRRSRKLLYENIVLRREAANRGNLPVESLLDSLEPILIDIANLPDKPAPADLRLINERMRRKNLVAMLQISAVESAARSY